MYDSVNRRLIYFGKQAHDATYWDNLWDTQDIHGQLLNSRADMEVAVTRKNVSLGSKILEGGCGLGYKTHALKKAGYLVVGIDFAARTVETVKKIVPELDVRIGDVRKLDFPDNYFDGYWSLGVIEHFWDGYEDIFSEAWRVLRPGGFFFLSFPQMSILRRIKANFGLYTKIPVNSEVEHGDFYQFALNPSKVAEDLRQFSFHVTQQKSNNGFKAIKDEISFIEPLLRFTQNNARHLPCKAFNKALDLLSSCYCGHSCLIIATKEHKL